MDKNQLQAKVADFKERLHSLFRISLSEELEEKYVEIYRKVLTAQSRSELELMPLFERASFVGHVFKPSSSFSSSRLVFSQDERAFANSCFCIVENVQANDNVLPFGKQIPKRVALVEGETNNLYKLAEITVYSTGNLNKCGINEPKLTPLDILSQIPEEFVSRVVAYELLNEKNCFLDRFNLVLNMHNFNVVLYGSVTD